MIRFVAAREPASSRWSRVWHLVLALVVLASLAVQVWLILTGGADVNADDPEAGPQSTGTRLANLFSYFTIQSNLLVLAAALTLVANPRRDGRGWRVLRLDAVLGIAITGLIYATVLAGLVHHTGIEIWVNAGFHYFSPWCTLLGWLLFGPRPRITWSTVGWAFGWPLAWIVYTFTRGAITGWYPYPFLDADRLGYPIALRNTGFVVLIAVGLALLLKTLDRALPPVPARPF